MQKDPRVKLDQLPKIAHPSRLPDGFMFIELNEPQLFLSGAHEGASSPPGL